MDITIVTIAYNGYGKFVDRWLEWVAASNTLPAKVIVALGPKHGLKDHNALIDKYSQLNLQFHFCESTKPLMGSLRNQAVNEAETEWIMYLSVDDLLLPAAIDEFARLEKEADYICISWESQAVWNKNAPTLFHQGKTPETLARKFGCKGFIVAHSPFRKKFWLMERYMDHDYPNAPFISGCIRNGARFVKTDVPCTRYLRRQDSHAARLGRRRGSKVQSEKDQANHWKAEFQRTMREFYL